MRSLVLAVAMVLCVYACLAACASGKRAPVSPAAETPAAVVTAVKGTIEQWRQGYEVRSLDALARLYAHDLDVVLVQEGLTVVGWSAIEAYLKDKLAHAGQIHIRLKDVQVVALGLEAASAVATMTREISDGATTVTEQGTLTLVLRSTPTGWVIASEHYSYKLPG